MRRVNSNVTSERRHAFYATCLPPGRVDSQPRRVYPVAVDKLYLRLTLSDGRHVYWPTVRGRHNRRLYRTAEKAQRHSETVSKRHENLLYMQRLHRDKRLLQAQRDMAANVRPGPWARLFGWRKAPEVA